MEIVLLIIIISIGIFSVLDYIKYKDLFNPLLVFISPIIFGYIVFMTLYWSEFISYKTYIAYATGVLSYATGYYLCERIYKYNRFYTDSKELYINKYVYRVFIMLSIISIIASFAYLSTAIHSGPYGDNFIRNLRYMSSYGGGANFISKYGSVVIKVLLSISLYRFFVNSKKTSSFIVVLLLLGVITNILTTIARTEVLEVFLIILYLYFYGKQVNKNKTSYSLIKYFVFILILFQIFIVIADLTGKSGSVSVLDSDFFIYRYFGEEILNFDRYILKNEFSSLGYHSFGFIGVILSKLGMGSNNDLFLYIEQYHLGAVSSFIAAPYADFGLVGILLTMIPQGFFHSYVYKNSINRGGYWAVFYPTCIYSSILSFYAFQYFMSSHIYMAILILIVSHSTKFGKN